MKLDHFLKVHSRRLFGPGEKKKFCYKNFYTYIKDFYLLGQMQAFQTIEERIVRDKDKLTLDTLRGDIHEFLLENEIAFKKNKNFKMGTPTLEKVMEMSFRDEEKVNKETSK